MLNQHEVILGRTLRKYCKYIAEFAEFGKGSDGEKLDANGKFIVG